MTRILIAFMLGLFGAAGLLLVPQSAYAQEPSKCATCHGDLARLQSLTERYARLYVDPEKYKASQHGGLACTQCHGGDPAQDDPKKACVGIANKNPSDPSVVNKTCGSCHQDITARHVNSLHSTLEGHRLALIDLVGEKAGNFRFTATCYECHATCSSCHMQDPDKRGMLWPRTESHNFSPAGSSANCSSCHGGMSDTYFGSKGHEPSLMAQAGIECADCHGDLEVHGDGTRPQFTMDTRGGPGCDDCHSDPTRQVTTNRGLISAPQYATDNPAHAVHDEDALSCEACHTQGYPNCWDCHQGRTQRSEYTLFLATNPVNGKMHPAARSPAGTGFDEGVTPTTTGGWAIKSRHSWGKSQECEVCHTSDRVYIVPAERGVPFIGYWTPARANASFVDPQVIDRLVFDASILEKGVHKEITCEGCHKSQTDDVCSKCHQETVKTGTTDLPAEADWSRQKYIAARASLEAVKQGIERAGLAGMDVTAWKAQYAARHEAFLELGNRFHFDPAGAQTAASVAAAENRTLEQSLLQAEVGHQMRRQVLILGLPVLAVSFGIVVVGWQVNRRRKKSREDAS